MTTNKTEHFNRKLSNKEITGYIILGLYVILTIIAIINAAKTCRGTGLDGIAVNIILLLFIPLYLVIYPIIKRSRTHCPGKKKNTYRRIL